MPHVQRIHVIIVLHYARSVAHTLNIYNIQLIIGQPFVVETDQYHFLELKLKPIPIFLNFFTDIWPVADILLATDSDIPKFAY